MIKKSEVDAALAAATRILAEESSFAWIKRTTLQVRAYFVGLYAGLSGIAREEDVRHILIDVLQKTIFWGRDDSFKSTRTGTLFDSLRQELLREEVDRPALLAAVQSLADHVDALDGEWNSRTKHARMAFEAAVLWNDATERNKSTQTIAEQRDRQSDKNRRLAEELEHVARHIALVDENWKDLDND